jgi:outer membrane protein OmpA-like peptidoglycan-associated protein
MKEKPQSRPMSSGTKTAPPIVREVLRGDGKPLDAEVRRTMEPRFGHDFEHVRVHTGGRAAESAEAVSAKAYTAGSNVVFGAGQFAPGTERGQQLLAHELAHTVQQRQAGSATGSLPIGAAGSATEKEADRAAQADGPVSLSAAPAMIARQPAGQEGEKKAPTNQELVEEALTKFLKAVKRAYPNESLPKQQLVINEAPKLAGAASQAPQRGPVVPKSTQVVKQEMEDFLRSNSAPTDPEKLAKAVVARLRGPVPQAVIDAVKNHSVFKPSKPGGLAGIADRYGKLAPADMPAANPQDALDQARQDAAMATQKTNPTLSPQLDPYRVGKAVKGWEDKDKPDYTNPPVKKPDEPAPPAGVVNRDIKLPSTVPALTVNKPIHFLVNQPGSVASDDKALKASLTPGGVTDLDMVIRWLQKGKEFGVQLTGMASFEGKKEHNQQLGENRARSVANALLRAGIGAEQIDDVPGRAETCTRLGLGIYNCGDTRAAKPVDPNDRRVEALLYVRPESKK